MQGVWARVHIHTPFLPRTRRVVAICCCIVTAVTVVVCVLAGGRGCSSKVNNDSSRRAPIVGLVNCSAVAHHRPPLSPPSWLSGTQRTALSAGDCVAESLAAGRPHNRCLALVGCSRSPCLGSSDPLRRPPKQLHPSREATIQSTAALHPRRKARPPAAPWPTSASYPAPSSRPPYHAIHCTVALPKAKTTWWRKARKANPHISPAMGFVGSRGCVIGGIICPITLAGIICGSIMIAAGSGNYAEVRTCNGPACAAAPASPRAPLPRPSPHPLSPADLFALNPLPLRSTLTRRARCPCPD